MRIVSFGIAAVTLATASFATPALAQYGGSPDQQVDGPAPGAVPGKPGLSGLQAELEADDDQYDPPAQAGPQTQNDPAAGGMPAVQYGPPDERNGPIGPGDQEEYARIGPDDPNDQYGQAGPDDQAGPEYENQGQPEYGEPDYDGEGPPPPPDPGAQTWQGQDGRAYCRRSDGTTGMIVGGGAGALIGSGIDSRGSRGAGTIIGAMLGALIGGAVERSSCR